MTDFEWGVWCNADNTLHREHMDETTAREWVRSWRDEVGPKARDMFSVCKRPVGKWETE